jgi:hypothetical protein
VVAVVGVTGVARVVGVLRLDAVARVLLSCVAGVVRVAGVSGLLGVLLLFGGRVTVPGRHGPRPLVVGAHVGVTPLARPAPLYP